MSLVVTGIIKKIMIMMHYYGSLHCLWPYTNVTGFLISFQLLYVFHVVTTMGEESGAAVKLCEIPFGQLSRRLTVLTDNIDNFTRCPFCSTCVLKID